MTAGVRSRPLAELPVNCEPLAVVNELKQRLHSKSVAEKERGEEKVDEDAKENICVGQDAAALKSDKPQPFQPTSAAHADSRPTENPFKDSTKPAALPSQPPPPLQQQQQQQHHEQQQQQQQQQEVPQTVPKSGVAALKARWETLTHTAKKNGSVAGKRERERWQELQQQQQDNICSTVPRIQPTPSHDATAEQTADDTRRFKRVKRVHGDVGEQVAPGNPLPPLPDPTATPVRQLLPMYSTPFTTATRRARPLPPTAQRQHTQSSPPTQLGTLQEGPCEDEQRVPQSVPQSAVRPCAINSQEPTASCATQGAPRSVPQSAVRPCTMNNQEPTVSCTTHHSDACDGPVACETQPGTPTSGTAGCVSSRANRRHSSIHGIGQNVTSSSQTRPVPAADDATNVVSVSAAAVRGPYAATPADVVCAQARQNHAAGSQAPTASDNHQALQNSLPSAELHNPPSGRYQAQQDSLPSRTASKPDQTRSPPRREKNSTAPCDPAEDDITLPTPPMGLTVGLKLKPRLPANQTAADATGGHGSPSQLKDHQQGGAGGFQFTAGSSDALAVKGIRPSKPTHSGSHRDGSTTPVHNPNVQLARLTAQLAALTSDKQQLQDKLKRQEDRQRQHDKEMRRVQEKREELMMQVKQEREKQEKLNRVIQDLVTQRQALTDEMDRMREREATHNADLKFALSKKDILSNKLTEAERKLQDADSCIRRLKQQLTNAELAKEDIERVRVENAREIGNLSLQLEQARGREALLVEELMRVRNTSRGRITELEQIVERQGAEILELKKKLQGPSPADSQACHVEAVLKVPGSVVAKKLRQQQIHKEGGKKVEGEGEDDMELEKEKLDAAEGRERDILQDKMWEKIMKELRQLKKDKETMVKDYEEKLEVKRQEIGDLHETIASCEDITADLEAQVQQLHARVEEEQKRRVELQERLCMYEGPGGPNGRVRELEIQVAELKAQVGKSQQEAVKAKRLQQDAEERLQLREDEWCELDGKYNLLCDELQRVDSLPCSGQHRSSIKFWAYRQWHQEHS